MRDDEHPSSALLLRFLRCETSQAEGRAVLLHLLAGCAQCCARTRPVWIEMERLARRWAETRPQPVATDRRQPEHNVVPFRRTR